jgi:valyl-tRNA synthetase
LRYLIFKQEFSLVKEIEKNYDASSIEDKWYQFWQEEGFFKANPNKDKKPFTIVIPPPNVTAALHMGHAYNNTIQDILIRWKRMQGFEALYQPGTDHAGIATQTVVEKELKKEGKSRLDLGRDEFVKRVWKWREHYGDRIINQLKKLGISADWDRERFTLDEGLSDAVQEVFVRLYEKGLVYKGNRIVNWDPASGTALSDDEVDHKEVNGKLYYLKYKIANTNEFITVATTRPETLLGDTGVAISPDDDEKKHLIGKEIIIPFVNRKVKIFADQHVDKEFGTGFVKATPAHDPNDFEMGQRNDLKQILVLDKDAKILKYCAVINGSESTNELEIPDSLAGLDRFEARKKIIELLDEMGQLEKIEDHLHSVGHSYRSNVAIEPYLSEQWFVKMKPLAERALKALQDGDIKFYPEGRYEKTYENWMNNIRDWCISRQLWWGHRIPVWYNENGDMKVSKTDPSTENEKWTQDEDVLDTWFSSWLWPFSTMGWPNNTEDLNYFYPSSVLVTGADIIFFWVARMVMAGYEFLGKLPFSEVYFNGIVRDSEGRKMSKSLGNGIDPLDVIANYSTDSVRYTVVQLSSQGQDIKLAEKDFEMGRNFSNKIWNSFRFLAMNLPKDFYSIDPYINNLELADKWILSRLQICIKETTKYLENYRFQDALASIYSFLWNEYCDWYLELIKQRLYKADKEMDKETALATSSHCLKIAMQLLHPFMPFITEEIWQNFKSDKDDKSIMITNWPTCNDVLIDPKSEKELEIIKDSIVAIRNTRMELNIPFKTAINMNVSGSNAGLFQTHSKYIKTLTNISEIKTVEKLEKLIASTSIVAQTELQFPLEGLIDIEQEVERLKKELNKKERILSGINSKLSNDRFINNAPSNIVEHEKAKALEIQEEMEKLKQGLMSFEV